MSAEPPLACYVYAVAPARCKPAAHAASGGATHHASNSAGKSTTAALAATGSTPLLPVAGFVTLLVAAALTRSRSRRDEPVAATRRG